MALTTIPSELSSVSGIADSSDATAITIDSSENVKINQKLSIGTTSTEGALNLNTNTNLTWGTDYSAIGSLKNSQGLLLGNNIKAGASNNTVVRHANGTDAGNFIKLAYNKGVTFHTGIATTLDAEVSEDSNERVRIDTTGKVGIGTDAPTHMLHVVDGNNYAVLGDTQSNSTMSLRMADTAAYPVEVQAYGNDLRINTASSANATPTVKMLVQYTGYVGIGETSPDNKLHITGGDWNNAHIKIERTDVGGSNDAGLVFKSAAGAATDTALGGIWFQNALDGNAYALIRARTDDSSGTSGRLDFMTGTSAVGNSTGPRVRISSTGEFYVYSDSSGGTANLEMDSNGVASFKPKDNTANIASFDTDTAGTTSGYIAFKTRGTYRGYIGNGSALSSNYNLDTDFHIRSEGARLVFLTNGNAPKIVIDGTAGNLLPHGDSTQNLGSTSKRWDNLYVNDMHFSNEGSDGNDVDGTTGDWTLQEGEEHLYIINNKSGKKFKFSLEEVN